MAAQVEYNRFLLSIPSRFDRSVYCNLYSVSTFRSWKYSFSSCKKTAASKTDLWLTAIGFTIPCFTSRESDGAAPWYLKLHEWAEE